MVVFDPQAQPAVAEARLQALPRLDLGGLTDGLTAFVEQDAVAAAEGGQRADQLQLLGVLLQALLQALQLQSQGAAEALFELRGEVLLLLQATPRMLALQSLLQGLQQLPARAEQALAQGALQAQVELVEALLLLAQPFAGMPQASL